MVNLCMVWIGVWEVLSFAPILGYLICSLSFLATGREFSPTPGFVRLSLSAQSPFDLSLSFSSSFFVLLCLLDLGFYARSELTPLPRSCGGCLLYAGKRWE